VVPIRIEVRSEGAECTLEMRGWLRSPEIEVFERACASQTLPFRIDLGQLVNVDDAGRRALLRQRARGARLVGASPYLALLMSQSTDADDGGKR
jgi:hypothetical protein